MFRNVRFVGYLALFAVIAAIALNGPIAWATPDQSNLNQTVPTRTPPSPPRPTDSNPNPTDQPRPTEVNPGQPGTPPPPGSTATPAPVLPATTGVPAAGARLALEKRADPDQVWPGMTLRYTLTLSNVGAASARQVVIEDVLPPGLEPGAILAGSGAAWDQRTLRARTAVLPPGGEYTVSFTARVAPDVGPGPALVNQATAAAAGGLLAQAEAVLVLPPVELPPVGAGTAGDMGGKGVGR